MFKKLAFLFFISFITVFQLFSVTFDDFKKDIEDKNGTYVHNYVTPLLKGDFESQITHLHTHIKNHGHFGIKDFVAKHNTTMRWNSFFIKPDYTLYEGEDEQKQLIRDIWNSNSLTYAQDIRGAQFGGVCLNGEINNIIGINFRNKSVTRIGANPGNNIIYNLENKIAVKIVELTQANPNYRLNLGDFVSVTGTINPTDKDNLINEVWSATPFLVLTSTIRVIYNIDETVSFNTSYPF